MQFLDIFGTSLREFLSKLALVTGRRMTSNRFLRLLYIGSDILLKWRWRR